MNSLRIATIHTPDSISNTMGMIAAILLGEFAIELGFFSGEILLFVSIGNVCDFATPNYELSLTNKYKNFYDSIFRVIWLVRFYCVSNYFIYVFNIIKTFWFFLSISIDSFLMEKIYFNSLLENQRSRCINCT